MYMWSSLQSWKHAAIYGFFQIFLFYRHFSSLQKVHSYIIFSFYISSSSSHINHRSSWSTKRFVCSCRNNIKIWKRRRQDLPSDQASDMRDISHQKRTVPMNIADFVSNRSKVLPIYVLRVCTESCNYHCRFLF